MIYQNLKCPLDPELFVIKQNSGETLYLSSISLTMMPQPSTLATMPGDFPDDQMGMDRYHILLGKFLRHVHLHYNALTAVNKI